MSSLNKNSSLLLRSSNSPVVGWMVAGILVLQFGIGTIGADEPTKPNANSASTVKPTWKPLVGSWEKIRFGGDGEVQITKELISLGVGEPLTGVRWTGEVVKEYYEIELEARRTSGFDFFCALTFPIGEEHASLVLGGWGGGVVGLSSINGMDASENETTQYKPLENNQWYKVRVRVTPKKVECFVDDSSIVDVEREDRLFSTRFEMDSSMPLGVAAYQCTSEIRNPKVRRLGAGSPGEVAIESNDAKPEVSK